MDSRLHLTVERGRSEHVQTLLTHTKPEPECWCELTSSL